MGRNLAVCCPEAWAHVPFVSLSWHAASCLQVSEVLDPRMLPPWPPPVPPAESEMNGAVKLKQTSSYHRSYHLGQEFQVHPGPGETEKDRRGRQLPNFLLVARQDTAGTVTQQPNRRGTPPSPFRREKKSERPMDTAALT